MAITLELILEQRKREDYRAWLACQFTDKHGKRLSLAQLFPDTWGKGAEKPKDLVDELKELDRADR